MLLVGDATFQLAGMDIVKWLLVDPWVFKVVHFKYTVGGGPGCKLSVCLPRAMELDIPFRLNRAEVCSDDFCRGVFTIPTSLILSFVKR